MNLTPNETLNKLMKMTSQAFTVEELRGLFTVMDAIKKVLTDILNDMEVPAMRRELNVHNLKWLARNLHF